MHALRAPLTLAQDSCFNIDKVLSAGALNAYKIFLFRHSRRKEEHMKYYEVAIVGKNDEWTYYKGFDLEKATKTYYDYKGTEGKDKIEARVYNIPDDTNIEDEDELTNAICDCLGYDPFIED